MMDAPPWDPPETQPARPARAADLLAAQEEERRRVSRELHDELGQRLALLEIQIEQLERQLGADSAAFSALESLRGRVGEIADDVHRICCRLHPAILENLGLVVALRAYCEEYCAWSGVKTRFSYCGVPAKLLPPIALCIYRVVQEALRNTGRHAQAERAVVLLRGSESAIHVTIKDNGRGFLMSEAERHSGLGLISMAERVELLGGTYSLRTAPGGGTRIQVSIPLPQPTNTTL